MRISPHSTQLHSRALASVLLRKHFGMHLHSLVLGLGLVLGVTASTRATVLPIDVTATLFGARPSAFAADLSPSGSKLVFLMALDGSRTGARVLDLRTKQIQNVIASTGYNPQVRSAPAALRRCASALKLRDLLHGPWIAKPGQDGMERAPTSAEGSAVESHRPQTVRSGAFRSMALSLEKAFSIGLKSRL